MSSWVNSFSEGHRVSQGSEDQSLELGGIRQLKDGFRAETLTRPSSASDITTFSLWGRVQVDHKGRDISYTAEFFKGLLKIAGLPIAVPGLILYVIAERLGSGLHYVSKALEECQNTKEGIHNAKFGEFLFHSKIKSSASKVVQGVLFLNPISVSLRAGIGALALLGAGAMRLGLGDENFRAVIKEVDGSRADGYIGEDSSWVSASRADGYIGEDSSWVSVSSFKGVASRIAASLEDINRAYLPEDKSSSSSNYGRDNGSYF